MSSTNKSHAPSVVSATNTNVSSSPLSPNQLLTNTDSYLKKEGIITANEQFETIYLAEDEIEKFMEKYMRENPDTEIETRYINQPPVEVVQDIEVRWLRPETPEIPPIIIKEIVDNTPRVDQPTIRIVQTSRKEQPNQQPVEPTIIRERPPILPIPEPKFAYVQNVIKRQVLPPNKPSLPEGKEIKVEHVRSESQTSFSNKGSLISDVKSVNMPQHQPPNFSFEEHHSIIEDEEEYDNRSEAIEDEHQLRLYEEKLKQTLYEEYLLRLEREKLERKLTASGLLDQRIRERSTSHERGSSILSNTRFSENLLNNSEYVAKLDRENELKGEQQRNLSRLRESHTLKNKGNESQLNESLGSGSETSTYKNIKFSKVVDQKELKRLNEILTNPNSPSIKNKVEGDQILSTFIDNTNKNAKRNETNIQKPNESIHRKIQPRSYQNTSDDSFSTVKNFF